MNARLRLVRPICNHWQVLLSLFLDIFVTFYCIVSLSVNITSSRPRHNLQWHIYNHKLLQDFDKRLHRRLLLADGFVRPWPPSNTCFLGSTWFSPQTASRSFQPFLHIPLQRLPVIFNGAGRTTPTKKIAPSLGSVPLRIQGSLSPPESAPQMASRFAVFPGLMKLTNRQSDWLRYSVCSNRLISLANAAMRPNNTTL